MWHTINSQVRLVHVNTSAALRFTGKNYPEWGFMQLEVASDRNIQQADTVWNVEEHRYTQNDKDKSTIEKEMMTHELIPEGQTQLTFWEKFWELQVKMLITNQENVQNHNFASDPTEWPFLTRGIAYYIAKESNNQVHLMGNIVVWYTGSICLLLYSSLLVFYLLRRRRLIYDMPEAEFLIRTVIRNDTDLLKRSVDLQAFKVDMEARLTRTYRQAYDNLEGVKLRRKRNIRWLREFSDSGLDDEQ